MELATLQAKIGHSRSGHPLATASNTATGECTEMPGNSDSGGVQSPC
jgi:hypothetical protein